MVTAQSDMLFKPDIVGLFYDHGLVCILVLQEQIQGSFRVIQNFLINFQQPLKARPNILSAHQ